ncbi:MAG: nucleotide exchange factor GrpE [Planctomycetes bacterium]|nr:nucleotide exchange factor GrpE [Planctomycetota bacterium]
MSQPKKRPTASENGGRAEGPDRDEAHDALESLPEILEVFGAAPLVHDFDFAPADAQHTSDTEDRSDESSGEPARDASGRFTSPHPDGDADADEQSDVADGDTQGAADDESSALDASSPPAPDDASVVLGGGTREIPLQPSRDVSAGASRPARETSQAVRLVVSDELSARLENTLAAGLVRMRELVGLSEQRLGKLEATLDDLSKQTSFLPGKLRGLGGKLDSLSGSLGDERSKGLLEALVSVLDLVDGALVAFPEGDAATSEPRRYFETIGTRLKQILEDHRLHPIPTDVPFDPALHHALQQLPVAEAERHGRIVEVYRRGWRAETGVLRYADVAVGRHSPQDAATPQVSPPAQPKGDETNGDPAGSSGGADAIPVHELDPSELDELAPPPGPPPRTVTDSSSITFRPAPPRNDRAR